MDEAGIKEEIRDIVSSLLTILRQQHKERHSAENQLQKVIDAVKHQIRGVEASNKTDSFRFENDPRTKSGLRDRLLQARDLALKVKKLLLCSKY